MIKLIGIVGRKRSGKDALFSDLLEICTAIRQPLKRFAFGDALKKEVSKATGVPLDVIEREKGRFRPILQWWGTEFRRKFCDESYWLPYFQEAMYSKGSKTILVVTDVRFQNEADLIRKNGGILVRIERAPAWKRNRWLGIFIGGLDNHSSEAGSDHIHVDMVLDNTGTRAELMVKAKELMNSLAEG